MSTRTAKILELSIQKSNSLLFLPKWETTKGVDIETKQLAIEGFKNSRKNADTFAGSRSHKRTKTLGSSIEDRDIAHNYSMIGTCPKHPAKSTAYTENDNETVTDERHETDNLLMEALNHDIIFSDITVENDRSDKKKQGSQKKHCCLYCKKHINKIYRHYMSVHKKENKVVEILKYPIKSAQRRSLLDDLRKEGDFVFNTALKTDNEREIVCKSSKNTGSRSKDVCCFNCKGYYSKLSMRHHLKRCCPTFKPNNEARCNIQSQCRKFYKLHPKASVPLKNKIFPYMHDDVITNIVRFDSAIITYGNYLCRKYTSDHNASQIRAHLRAFGRLLIAIKEANAEVQNLSDILNAKNVGLIVEAIEKVAGLDTVLGYYRAPATAISLGTELKKLCKILQMEYLTQNDKVMQKTMKDLLIVFDMEFGVTINKKGIESQKIIKRRKKTVLPETEQIAAFRKFLEEKVSHYINKLTTSFSKLDWIKLTEHTLVLLAVFNRKRPGETQRILVDDYKNYEILEEHEAPDCDLLTAEQMKKWARIKFTGKLGRDNALLIHRDIGFKAIDLILKYREQAGVHPLNKYIFGEPSSFEPQKTFQACGIIRKLSSESGIKDYKLLRTRLLRQHLATETASKNVDLRLENRISDFMAHKKQIHEDYYVLTKKKDDITKVSTVLESLSSSKSSSVPPKRCSIPNLDSASSSSMGDCPQSSEITDDLLSPIPGVRNIWTTPERELLKETTKQSSIANESDLVNSSSSDDYPEQSEITDAEVNYLLGKRRSRSVWSTEEKKLARDAFQVEINHMSHISRAKVKKFHQMNRTIYQKRTPHLIMQWIKNEQIRVNDEKHGRQLIRERWTTPEKAILNETIKRHSRDGSNPSLKECGLLLEDNQTIFKKRTPESIKSFVYAIVKKHQRNSI